MVYFGTPVGDLVVTGYSLMVKKAEGVRFPVPWVSRIHHKVPSSGPAVVGCALGVAHLWKLWVDLQWPDVIHYMVGFVVGPKGILAT